MYYFTITTRHPNLTWYFKKGKSICEQKDGCIGFTYHSSDANATGIVQCYFKQSSLDVNFDYSWWDTMTTVLMCCLSLFCHHLSLHSSSFSLSLSLFFIIFLSDRKSFPPTHNAQQWGRRTCWTTRLVCTRTQAITLPTHASTSLQTACTVVDGTTWQAPWRSKACTTRSKAALPLADGRIPHRQTWCTG